MNENVTTFERGNLDLGTNDELATKFRLGIYLNMRWDNEGDFVNLQPNSLLQLTGQMRSDSAKRVMIETLTRYGVSFEPFGRWGLTIDKRNAAENISLIRGES